MNTLEDFAKRGIAAQAAVDRVIPRARPRPYPPAITRRALALVRQYLATAEYGPGGAKKGAPAMWTIDASARALLATVAALEEEGTP